MSDEPIFVRGWLPAWGVQLARALFILLFRIFTRLEVRGLENLPASGGVVVSPNHLTHLEAPLVFGTLGHRKTTVFSAEKYRRRRFFRMVLQMVDVIWVNREAPSPATMKAAVAALRAGDALGVAPEGTRSQVTHALQPAKTGAAYLSVAAGVPVVPAAISGTDRVIPGLLQLRRVPVTITYGRPLIFAEPSRAERARKLEEYTTEIMCQLAALLPPEYRGVYAGHPRTRELLASPPSPSPGGPGRGVRVKEA